MSVLYLPKSDHGVFGGCVVSGFFACCFFFFFFSDDEFLDEQIQELFDFCLQKGLELGKKDFDFSGWE